MSTLVVEKITPTPIDSAPCVTGWMADNGDFYACEPCNHEETGKAIIEAKGWRQGDSSVYTFLYRHGFIHITFGAECDMGWSYQENRPNATQLDRLFDLWFKAEKDSTERHNIMDFIKRNDPNM